jgi:hypothetical protein
MYGKFVQTPAQKVQNISAIFIPILASQKTNLPCSNSVGIKLLAVLGISLNQEVVVEIGSKLNTFDTKNGSVTENQMTVNLVTSNERVAGKLADKMDFTSEDVSFKSVGTVATPRTNAPLSDEKIGERVLTLKGAAKIAYDKALAANPEATPAEVWALAFD